MQLDNGTRQRVIDALVVAENRILINGLAGIDRDRRIAVYDGMRAMLQTIINGSFYFDIMEQAHRIAADARARGDGAYNEPMGAWY